MSKTIIEKQVMTYQNMLLEIESKMNDLRKQLDDLRTIQANTEKKITYWESKLLDADFNKFHAMIKDSLNDVI